MTSGSPRHLAPPQQLRLTQWDIEHSVDVHCHCLPSLDDGPRDLEAAVELCRELVADGITTVIASPHQLGRYDGITTPDRIRATADVLRAELGGLGIPLNVSLGADVRIDERLGQLVDGGEVLTAGPAG